jgi:predicted Rdx family selenoprotein
LTEKLLKKGKQRIQSLELFPFGDGRFEVYKDNKKIYSKLESREFPDDDKMVQAIL